MGNPAPCAPPLPAGAAAPGFLGGLQGLFPGIDAWVPRDACGGSCAAGQFCDPRGACRPDTCAAQREHGCPGDGSALRAVACPPGGGFKDCFAANDFVCFKGPGASRVECNGNGASSSASSYASPAAPDTPGSASAGATAGGAAAGGAPAAAAVAAQASSKPAATEPAPTGGSQRLPTGDARAPGAAPPATGGDETPAAAAAAAPVRPAAAAPAAVSGTAAGERALEPAPAGAVGVDDGGASGPVSLVSQDGRLVIAPSSLTNGNATRPAAIAGAARPTSDAQQARPFGWGYPGAWAGAWGGSGPPNSAWWPWPSWPSSWPFGGWNGAASTGAPALGGRQGASFRGPGCQE
jgi:hypothetical protein